MTDKVNNTNNNNNNNMDNNDYIETYMTLTEQEREWAISIKNALADEKDETILKNITDLEIAQHAIVAKEKTAKALNRIRRLHEFKQENYLYNVSYDDAIQMLRKFNELAPGYIASSGRDEKTGRLVLGIEYQAFCPNKFNESPETWKVLFGALYFQFEAASPNIKAIRDGVVWLADAHGMGLKNFSMEMEKKSATLYQDAYPMRIKEITILKAYGIVKLIYALMRPFLSEKLKNILNMQGELDDIQSRYSKDILPTIMGGTQTQVEMSQDMEASLKERFEAKSTFQL